MVGLRYASELCPALLRVGLWKGTLFQEFQGDCQWNVYIFSNMASENVCALQSRKNIIFQNKTLLLMFYRQNKTFWYQFCNFKHFLKAENCEDVSLASSCEEFCIGFHACNPV